MRRLLVPLCLVAIVGVADAHAQSKRAKRHESTEFTLAGWVLPAGAASRVLAVPVPRGGDTDGLFVSEGAVEFRVTVDGRGRVVTGALPSTRDSVHVAVTADRTTLLLYVGGRLVDRTSLPPKRPDIDFEVDATVFDEAIVTSRALSAREIAALAAVPPRPLLSVLSVTPAADASGVSLDVLPEAVFSEALDESSITASAVTVLDTRDMAVSGTLAYDAARRAVQFAPSEPLLPTRPYRFVVQAGASGVRSSRGALLTTPLTVTFRTTIEPAHIAVGDAHSIVLDEAGQVWTWGSNSLGQLGRDGNAAVPARVPGAVNVTAVAAGARHTLALRTDGTVLAWGHNAMGQLGIGDTSISQQSLPVAVPGLSDVTMVAAGLFTSVAVRRDGSVWTWGVVSGLGADAMHSSPVPVAGLPPVTAVAAGVAHVVALAGDGDVWTWGANVFGGLGDGTTTASVAPIRVAGASASVGIAAGAFSTFAITPDLSLLAWGRAEDGQTARLLPVPISDAHEVRAVAAGISRAVVGQLNDEIRGWGVGAGAGGASAPVPSVVTRLPRTWQVAAGTSSQLALSRDGILLAWTTGTQTTQLTGRGYAWKASLPAFSHPAGTYDHELKVAIRSATPGAVVRYTLDGSEPTESSAPLDDGRTLDISTGVSVMARAWAAGHEPSDVVVATYTFKAATPRMDPPGGTYLVPPTVSLASSTGAGIYVTTDGTPPTETSPVYAGPFLLAHSATVKAIAIRPGWLASDVAEITYRLSLGTLGAPASSPAPGVYEEQVLVSLTAPPGASVVYTTDGSAPHTSSPVYGGPLRLTRTTTLRAKAVRADFDDSPELLAIYRIAAAAPVIAPASATFMARQSVTMAAAAPATVRFTLDGTDPTPASPAFVAPFTVEMPTTVKARAYRDDVEPSAIASSVLHFKAPPVTIAPRAGIYGSGQAITLASDPGATIRYTLDGQVPTSESPAYEGSFTLSATAVVTAVAFRDGWQPGSISRASFTIAADITPPAITAIVSPPPGPTGWHHDDVTVTFTCSDSESAVTFCTAPQTVRGEGAGLQVRGHARDAIGNMAFADVTLKIDRTPPLISVFAPADDETLVSGTASVRIAGQAFDLAGTAELMCQGRPGVVEEGRFSCDVAVAEGENRISITARDLVGLEATRTITFHVGDGPPPVSVAITPERMTMTVGESRVLLVKDDRGRPVPVTEWSEDIAGLVRVSSSDGERQLEAIAPGHVVLTASYRGLMARAMVEVLAVGVVPAPGTVVWTSTAGEVSRRATIVPAVAGVDDEPRQSAAFFFVDEATHWFGTDRVRDAGAPLTIRTVTVDGRELWTRRYDDRATLVHVAADAAGGLVLVWDRWFDGSGGYHPSFVQRLDGQSGHATWEYRPQPEAFLSEVAAHPDGRVFFTEERLFGESMLIAASANGAIARWLLPPGRQQVIDTGEAAMDNDFATPAPTTHPIIDDDGTVIVIAKRTIATRYVHSRFDGDVIVVNTDFSMEADVRSELMVLRLGDDGGMVEHVVDREWTAFKPNQYRLLPDGAGGLLLGHRHDLHMVHIAADDHTVTARELFQSDLGAYTYGHEYALGDGGVYLVSHEGANGGMTHSTSSFVIDPGSLDIVSAVRIVDSLPEPSNLRLQFAIEGGGVHLTGPSTGVAHTTPVAEGVSAAWAGGPSLVVGGGPPPAETEWASPSGTPHGGNVAFHPGFGVFVKGHAVPWDIGRHASFRIVPRDQEYWLARRPHDFVNIDSRGRRFATLGAGPSAEVDTATACDGSLRLLSDINREGDVTVPPEILDRVNYRTSAENAVVQRLLDLDANYRDNLKYCVIPSLGADLYNSNSYVAGLLRAAGLPRPMGPALTLPPYAGWFKPVPASEFASRP